MKNEYLLKNNRKKRSQIKQIYQHKAESEEEPNSDFLLTCRVHKDGGEGWTQSLNIYPKLILTIDENTSLHDSIVKSYNKHYNFVTNIIFNISFL